MSNLQTEAGSSNHSSVPRLEQSISVGSVELMLLDAEGEMLASQEFDLNELGDIPGKSARPWVFVFTKGQHLCRRAAC